MSRSLADPDLAAITRALIQAHVAFVVIGGFAVIANDYVRATEDVAGLASVVAFKRLGGRPRDRVDLEELREIHGELPIDPLPGLDV